MASARPFGSQLRCRKARNGAVSRRVVERRACVVVIAITFICAGAACGSRTLGGRAAPGSEAETDRAAPAMGCLSSR